tara:strand:+ start:836 stop:1522 length:687 start_codon:yes stop_codon:yes gene_type:complete
MLSRVEIFTSEILKKLWLLNPRRSCARAFKMVKTHHATTQTDVSNWCVDKAIKRERKANARKVLSDKPPQSSPNPFKRTYLLKMRWSYSNEQTVERITPLNPATCIGKGATFKKTGPRVEGGAGGALYLLSKSCFTYDYEDSEVEEEEDENIYFGEHPLPGYGGSDQIRDFAKEGDTSDVLGQKLVHYELDCPLVIDQGLWAGMTPATQEAILRDSSAKIVFICDAQF